MAATGWKTSFAIAFLACELVRSCAWPPIGEHQRVEGWPELQIVERRVAHHAFRDVCVPATAWYLDSQACASFDFRGGRCFIWTSAEFPPPAGVIEHERLHCRGFDHQGSSVMAGLLQRHRDSVSRSVASLPR